MQCLYQLLCILIALLIQRAGSSSRGRLLLSKSVVARVRCESPASKTRCAQEKDKEARLNPLAMGSTTSTSSTHAYSYPVSFGCMDIPSLGEGVQLQAAQSFVMWNSFNQRRRHTSPVSFRSFLRLPHKRNSSGQWSRIHLLRPVDTALCWRRSSSRLWHKHSWSMPRAPAIPDPFRCHAF